MKAYNEEYNPQKNFEITGSGAFGYPNEWNYMKGDTVKAQLYSWQINSTGEIVRREIHTLK